MSEQFFFHGELAKVDKEKREVSGYASTEKVDSSGEKVLKSAVKAALPDFMKFANLREMHQLKAVGTVTEAKMDDTGLHIIAKVVDDSAWSKVKEGVLKGFSIGGKTLARDLKDRKTITKISLYEISLVDRPDNDQTLIDSIKAAGGATGTRLSTGSRDVGAKLPAPDGAVMTVPQMWLAHGKLLEAAEKMIDGPKKDAEKRDLDQMRIDILAAAHRQRNAARSKILDEKSKLFAQPHEHPALSS